MNTHLPLPTIYMRRIRIFHIALSLLLATATLAQKQTPQEYIAKYKDLAIIEMHRSGVPASITLSQGVLESNSGNSNGVSESGEM